MFLIAILVRLAHSQVSPSLFLIDRVDAGYISLGDFGLICGKARAHTSGLLLVVIFAGKNRKVDRAIYIYRKRETERENERDVGKRTNDTREKKYYSIVLTLLIMVITETRDVIAATAIAPSRRNFCGEKKKKKNFKKTINMPIIARVSPICAVSARVCLIGSLPALYRQSAPRAHLGITILAGRIRAELAVHASANCYWKKGGKKGKKKENNDKPLSTLADWNVVYAGVSSTGNAAPLETSR